MNLPCGFGDSTDEMLQRTLRAYRDEQDALPAIIAGKSEILRHYDVPQMQGAVAMCFWGRSGSFLLISYLDDHDDIVMLPLNLGELIYPFFGDYEPLSVWEKLLAFPFYSEWKQGPQGRFFQGDYAIGTAEYFAAIHALFDAYGDRPAAWLDARPRFVQFLHVAYNVARGRRPGSSRPLMIYSQHWTNDELAQRFIEDFPSGRFVHTVRDPISVFDSWFDRETTWHTDAMADSPGKASRHFFSPAVSNVRFLLARDGPHRGMEARTRAVRFEDLHLAPAATMQRLADWIGIPYRASLLESTFNGIPYVVTVGGVTWVGANPENARRRSKNLDRADRLTLYALLHENFAAWNYACPRLFHRRWVCLLTIALLLPIPMKMEAITARMILQQRAFSSVRSSRFGFACGVPLYLMARRLQMMLLVAKEAGARLAGKRKLLELL